MSALRQGMSMSLFFFGYYNYLRNKKYKPYVVFSILSIMCHEVGYLSLVVLIIELLLSKFDVLNNKKIIIALGACALLVSIFSPTIISYIYDYMGHFQAYIVDTTPDYRGLSLRILLLLCVSIIYIYLDEEKRKEYNNQVYFYYLITLVYCAFSWIDSFSRFIDYYAIVELILIPNMIMDIKKPSDNRVFIFMLVIILIYVAINYTMLADDINYLCTHKNYGINFSNYPYYLIFKYIGGSGYLPYLK